MGAADPKLKANLEINMKLFIKTLSYATIVLIGTYQVSADEQIETFKGGDFTNPFFVHDIEFDDNCCRGFEFRSDMDGFAFHLRPNTDFITFNLKEGQQVESVSVTVLDFEGGFRGDAPTSFIAFRSASGDFVGFNAKEIGVPFTAFADRNTPGQINGKPLGDIVQIQLQAANEGNSVFPKEFGAYFDNIVIVISNANSAELNNVVVTTGMILNGNVNSLRCSDDEFFHTRSGFGQTVVDLHSMEMIVNAATTVDSATLIDLTIESRIDEPAGLAQIRMRNWNTNQFESVGQYALGNTDQIDTINNIDATDYIDGNGNIDLSIKHIVFVPFLAFTFESFIDQTEITVN